MDALDCIRTRRSIRKYTPRAIAMDIVGHILDAGRMAPTAGNLQNYKVILVKSKAKRAAIADACIGQDWMKTAPVHMVLVAEPQRARQFYYERGEKVYSIMNIAAIAENMGLAAWALGLGTCLVGAFDELKLQEVLGTPDYVLPYLVLTVGYPDEKPEIPDRFKLWDMVFLEGWERRIANVGFSTREISPTVAAKVGEVVAEASEKANSFLDRIRDKTLDAHKRIRKRISDHRAKRKK
ncbi:MAG: nitroreductase family protein [archaeon]